MKASLVLSIAVTTGMCVAQDLDACGLDLCCGHSCENYPARGLSCELTPLHGCPQLPIPEGFFIDSTIYDLCPTRLSQLGCTSVPTENPTAAPTVPTAAPTVNEGYTQCADCQMGCGGEDSEECWNTEHTGDTEETKEFGICDCDGEFGDTEDCISWQFCERKKPDACDTCIESCQPTDYLVEGTIDEIGFCHGCIGEDCYDTCVAVRSEDIVDDYINNDCDDGCKCPEGYFECDGFCKLDEDCKEDDWCEKYGDLHDNCRLECDEEPHDDHDSTKCRETDWVTHAPMLDEDCCGQEYETWCADGYEKVANVEGQEDCKYRCYPSEEPPKECRDCSTMRGRNLLFARVPVASLPCCE